VKKKSGRPGKRRRTSSAVHPSGWPRPSGYTHGISGRGRLLFISGQIGCNPRTQQVESDDFAAQAKQALENIVAVLGAAGGRAEDLVRLTWYVTDRNAYLGSREELGAAYRDVMGRHFPAMSVIFVSGLVEERARVEIEATAMLAE